MQDRIKNLLKNIPTIIANKWPKKTFLGWANSLSWNTNTIKEVDPKENISQNPVDVSKLRKERIPMIIEANSPARRGSNFFDNFIYIFF